MKKAILTSAILLAAGMAQASEDLTPRIDASRAAVKSFMTQLKGELQAGMKAGGPVNAIDVCHTKAPEITSSVSKEKGWEIGRTSLKPRNPANKPDQWELAVLKKFEQRKAAGEDPKKMEYSEVVETDGKQTFRYMKAIPTGAICLTCHGEKLAPEVEAKLKELYPEDQALGYKEGDIRGAFTIKQPISPTAP
ncbi:MAG: hypothetical protein DSZ32_05650 [Gammaproteobacteria bacterium]|nr:MAG: hypothetical protein DSZ32_05650 [Gammaproteobacteria bacterium]